MANHLPIPFSPISSESQDEQKGPFKKRSKLITEWDQYGRTGRVQVLHIDLFYADGTKGVINVTSPGIIWGEDIETQWIGMRTYLQDQHQRLGIVGYHAHAHQVDPEGTITKSFSWFPFDFTKNQEIIPQP